MKPAEMSQGPVCEQEKGSLMQIYAVTQPKLHEH